jgi:hypothetical protein
MQLENFEFLTRNDWPEAEQCILKFGDFQYLSIIRHKNTGTYEIEFNTLGYSENPFDKNLPGNISNISEEKMNQYIFLLTILTGSHPTQL